MEIDLPPAPLTASADDGDDGAPVVDWEPAPPDPSFGWRRRLTDELRPTIETLDRLRERDLLD
jgi:hypothetical protein